MPAALFMPAVLFIPAVLVNKYWLKVALASHDDQYTQQRKEEDAMRTTLKSSGSWRVLKLLLILALVFTMIPVMPGEAASTKSKAIAAYKKKLSKSKVTVLPRGKKVLDINDNYVTYRSSKKANVKFALAYIDNNNVPELILEDSHYGYGVWTYKGGKVTCVLWGDSYDEPYGYYRKKGIYEERSWTEGSPFYKIFYKYKNGKMTKKLTKFVYEVGEPEAEYYFCTKPYYTSVSKATFRKKLKSYVGSTKVTKFKLKKNNSSNRKKYLK